jgi:hypothetical protein
MSDPIPGNDPNAAYDVVPSTRWPKEWLTREKYSENYSQQPDLQGFSAADEIEELLKIARAEEWPAPPRRAVWTVTCNGIPVWHCPTREKAERYATDREYRASLMPIKYADR